MAIAPVCLALAIETVAASTESGRVRLSSNPHYLEFRGRPVLLLGDSVTQGWMEGGPDFDQRGYLDALARRGINAVLLWSYIATGAPLQTADPRVGYDAPELYPWKGSTDRRSVDLRTFNPAYFERLRKFVSYAETKGIVVVLTVQDGWVKTRFAHHPFNAALGNGPLTDRRQFVELADYEQEMPVGFRADWSWQQQNQYFQERLAEKLITELAAFSNIAFELFNEGEWYDREMRRRHEEHFLRFFRRRTAALLMTNTDHVRSVKWMPRENPAVDILSLHKKPWSGQYPTFVKEFRAAPVRVIFESEPVPSVGDRSPSPPGEVIAQDTVCRTVWERALSGAGFVAQNDTSWAWNPRCRMAKQAGLRDEVYDVIGHAARFFNQSGVPFWEMEPHGEIASTGVCLARLGAEYVVYAPSAGPFTVDLSSAEGRALSARWYDARTGRFEIAETISGGGVQTFIPPLSHHAVLRLRNASAAESVPRGRQ